MADVSAPVRAAAENIHDETARPSSRRRIRGLRPGPWRGKCFAPWRARRSPRRVSSPWQRSPRPPVVQATQRVGDSHVFRACELGQSRGGRQRARSVRANFTDPTSAPDLFSPSGPGSTKRTSVRNSGPQPSAARRPRSTGDLGLPGIALRSCHSGWRTIARCFAGVRKRSAGAWGSKTRNASCLIWSLTRNQANA